MSIPGKRPKLIATDLDGTIVVHGSGYDESQIRQRTIDAFKAAHDLGIHIYFVTGRPPRWMAEIRDAFTFGKSICANGAMLYDFMKEEVLEEWGISTSNQIELARILRLHIPNISFAIEYGDEFHHEIAYVPRWDIGVDMQPIDKIEVKMVRPAFKMLARCSDYDMSSDEMLEIAIREAGHLATITHSSPTESLLEISATGVSKGETLAMVAARLGVDAADCVSFGDNPNDFSMLEWTGRSWAMGDGHRDGIKHAKFVAEPHHTDSVARIIEELIALPV